jgi:hypothetical protein
VTVLVAAAMAVLAATLFAIAAVAQNGAVATVVRSPDPTAGPMLGAGELRALARSRTWLVGTSLAAIASVIHAGALVLAPVAIVQPIGVLSVPFALVIAAQRTRIRPTATVLATVVVCLGAVAGFVALADAQLGTSAAPRFAGVVAAAVGAGLAAGLLALCGSRLTGWRRCVAFAASAATAFGLVSALMRLIALHLSSGVNDLDDMGVWLPAAGVAAALLGGGWAVQQAHAVGAPAVVVGCLTVIDPLVAVALGVAMLGEGRTTAPTAVLGLVALAALALTAAILLAQQHPAADPPAALAAPVEPGVPATRRSPKS